ncbi:MAG: YggT family protein, partial [Alloalcanivorax venustensis]
MNPQGAAVFLIDFAFSVYIFIVLTRFVLQLARADFYNPISQFVLRATNPLLAPLRRIIPGYRGLDIASLVLILILIVVKALMLLTIQTGGLPAGIGPQLLVYTLRELASLILDYVFWAVLVRVILSWSRLSGWRWSRISGRSGSGIRCRTWSGLRGESCSRVG